MTNVNVRDLLQQLNAARRGDMSDLARCRPELQRLDQCDDLELVGQALDGVPPSALFAPGTVPKELRVGVISSFNADAVVPFLRVLLVQHGIMPAFYVAGYNQHIRELADPQSGLAAFGPQVTLCLLHDAALLPDDWAGLELDAVREYGLGRVEELGALLAGFCERNSGLVLLNTVPLPPVQYHSLTAHKEKARFARIWRTLAGALLELAERHQAVHVVDLECLLADHNGPLYDRRLYRFASMAWTHDVLLVAAREAVKLCRALLGLSKKCLVLDLDNTLWGGVLGDDGPEGIQIGSLYPGNCYLELQRRAKGLERQGVLLAVCSKNEQTLVDEVFRQHPDLLLRSGDFAMVSANWEPKDRNLAGIAETLNIGQDSLVFLDDSHFECQLVEGSLPSVTVVHATGDPADYADKLLSRGYFDVLATTAEDRQRTGMYRAQVMRQDYANQFASVEEYLRQLEIRVAIFPADAYSLPRLVQLNLRTNQFNMTTLRLGEAEMKAMACSPHYLMLGFEAGDRFHHEGIVGSIWVRKDGQAWWIENFVMSCRVFSRNIEHAVLHYVVDRAVEEGAAELFAEYRPTAKNKVVANLYDAVGFSRVQTQEDGRVVYRLPLSEAPQIAKAWVTLRDDGRLANV